MPSVQSGVRENHSGLSVEMSDDQEKLGFAVQKDHSASSLTEILTFDHWDLDQMELVHTRQDIKRVLDLIELEENSLSLEDPGGQLELSGGQKSEGRTHDRQEGVFTKKMKIQRTEDEKLKCLDKQRLSHIKVERNRRTQMNKSIAILKDMLPPHQLTKNDQASVIGGVVEFISGLQQLLKTLEERKLRKEYSEILSPRSSSAWCPAVLSSLTSPLDGDIRSALRSALLQVDWNHSRDMSDTYQVNTDWAKVMVTKLQTFVDVLIETVWRPGQLIQIIVALQSLYLNVMQMDIAKENNKTLRLVIRTELDLHCRFGVKELATAIHQTLTYLSSSS